MHNLFSMKKINIIVTFFGDIQKVIFYENQFNLEDIFRDYLEDCRPKNYSTFQLSYLSLPISHLQILAKVFVC